MRGVAKSDFELLQKQVRQLKRENAKLKADLRWIDVHLDLHSFVQLFGEEQDVGSLQKMIALARAKEPKR